MLKPITGTIEDHITIYSYRISLLKVQIHSSILSSPNGREAPTASNTNNSNFQTYQLELETWLADWKAEVLSNIEIDVDRGPHFLPVLESWAMLNYHHTALLLIQLSGKTSDDILHHIINVVQPCILLLRHQNKSLPALLQLQVPNSDHPFHPITTFDLPVFPINWTVAHLMLSTSLSALDGNNGRVFMAFKNEGILRRCLTALAMLEGDPAMLSTGFAEIFERLCDEAEKLSAA